MSNQFSYELDERKIRLMMQDAELDFNESMWQKFDELSASQYKSTGNIGNYIPTINFGISRSIIVPVIFIVLIGGLSAMLFSFVDFKKKEAIDKEIPYVAKIEPIKTKVIAKPIIKTKAIATPSANTVSSTDTSNLKVISTTTINTAVKPIDKKAEAVTFTESKPKKNSITATTETKKETIIVPQKKKKKIKPEALPTIITTTPNLNEGAGEPELDLK